MRAIPPLSARQTSMLAPAWSARRTAPSAPPGALRPLQPLRAPPALPRQPRLPRLPPPWLTGRQALPPKSHMRWFLNGCGGWGGVVVGLKLLLPWLLPGSKLALLLSSAPFTLWLLPLGTVALCHSGWVLLQASAGQRWRQARQVIVTWPQRMDQAVRSMSAVERGMHFGMLTGASLGLLLQGPLGVLPGMVMGMGLGLVSGTALESIYQLQRLWAGWCQQDVQQLQRWDARCSYMQQLALYMLLCGVLLCLAYVVATYLPLAAKPALFLKP